MDKTSKLFDVWANTGRSEEMEKGHGATVNRFLDKLSLNENFRFLDIGCGNGWVVRKMSQKSSCIKAIGIDKSKMMIKNAKSKILSKKETYFVTQLESWNAKEKFDIIFSMESLYYSVPMEPALEKVYKLLKKGGTFYCGTDFYSDNTLTTRWVKDMDIPMDLRSEKEWKQMFRKVGFTTSSKHVTDSKNKSKWKREFGTLFIIGRKI
ncbi:MAG: class I SAM-dependent methyltransferase [Crenarchaeota archaeon]|nr:class I SAM-dependent methyltransferase [Thermoproteota archaeon]MDA1124223.1 class I SAM-dependent methyltransferase [Thermoproteota archaeon]